MPPIIAALLGSGLAIAGSLYLSLGLGLKACPLCFYQRTFAFSLVCVLFLGLFTLPEPRRVLLLAFPLALGGFGVALLHSYLVWSETLECPQGLLGLRSAPEQSLVVYTGIVLCFLEGFRRNWKLKELPIPGILAGIILGGAAVYGSIVANPMPPTPTAPYPTNQPLDTCRLPYRG